MKWQTLNKLDRLERRRFGESLGLLAVALGAPPALFFQMIRRCRSRRNLLLSVAWGAWVTECNGVSCREQEAGRPGEEREKEWLGDRDSNPDRQSQSLQSYR